MFDFITTVQPTRRMYEVRFIQLTHWHLKQIVIASDVMLGPLESKEKYIMGVYINLCRCTDKIIYNHLKTWLGPGE